MRFLSQVKAEQQLEPGGSELVPSHQFLAVLVGIQGSGKSNLAKQMQAQRSGDEMFRTLKLK